MLHTRPIAHQSVSCSWHHHRLLVMYRGFYLRFRSSPLSYMYRCCLLGSVSSNSVCISHVSIGVYTTKFGDVCTCSPYSDCFVSLKYWVWSSCALTDSLRSEVRHSILRLASYRPSCVCFRFGSCGPGCVVTSCLGS